MALPPVRHNAHRHGGLLFIPGLLLASSIQTFSEPLAVVLITGVIVSGLHSDRVSPQLLPVAVAATITRETAAPFVMAFGLVAVALSHASPL